MGHCTSELKKKKLVAYTNSCADKIIADYERERTKVYHTCKNHDINCKILEVGLSIINNYIDWILGKMDKFDNLTIEEMLLKSSGNFTSIYSSESNTGDTLILCSKSIINIPMKINQLKNVTYIHACCNFLTRFPKSLAFMKKVKFLVLSNNRIEFLPDVFERGNSLVSVNLCNNRLKTLPKSFSNLKKLENLNLSSNKFTHLPVCISGCSSLRFLEINSNNIKAIPIEIIRLKRLTTIYCFSNNFIESDKPNFINSIPSLKSLACMNLDLKDTASFKHTPAVILDYLRSYTPCSYCGNNCYEGGYEYIDMQVFVFEKLPVIYHLCRKHFGCKQEKVVMAIERGDDEVIWN